MGLLDQITSMTGGLGNLSQLMNNPQIQQLMNNPQVANIIKNLDADTLQKLVANVQKNGLPKDMASIQKLIQSFTSGK